MKNELFLNKKLVTFKTKSMRLMKLLKIYTDKSSSHMSLLDRLALNFNLAWVTKMLRT